MIITALKQTEQISYKHQVDKNIVTVSTASTHGLNLNDNVKVTIKPTGDQTVDVRYDDFNRRIVFDPVGFTFR